MLIRSFLYLLKIACIFYFGWVLWASIEIYHQKWHFRILVFSSFWLMCMMGLLFWKWLFSDILMVIYTNRPERRNAWDPKTHTSNLWSRWSPRAHPKMAEFYDFFTKIDDFWFCRSRRLGTSDGWSLWRADFSAEKWLKRELKRFGNEWKNQWSFYHRKTIYKNVQ